MRVKQPPPVHLRRRLGAATLFASTVIRIAHCSPAPYATNDLNSEDCSLYKCDCFVSPWSAWGACSSSCGVGTSSRSRTILRSPDNNGKPCPELTQSQTCQVPGVTDCNTDCVLSVWSAWKPCQNLAGSCLKMRNRKVVTPASGSGAACGDLTVSSQCDDSQCTTNSVSWFPQWMILLLNFLLFVLPVAGCIFVYYHMHKHAEGQTVSSTRAIELKEPAVQKHEVQPLLSKQNGVDHHTTNEDTSKEPPKTEPAKKEAPKEPPKQIQEKNVDSVDASTCFTFKPMLTMPPFSNTSSYQQSTTYYPAQRVLVQAAPTSFIVEREITPSAPPQLQSVTYTGFHTGSSQITQPAYVAQPSPHVTQTSYLAGEVVQSLSFAPMSPQTTMSYTIEQPLAASTPLQPRSFSMQVPPPLQPSEHLPYYAR